MFRNSLRSAKLAATIQVRNLSVVASRLPSASQIARPASTSALLTQRSKGTQLPFFQQQRHYSEKIINTPQFTDSITEGELAKWEVKVGSAVQRDQLLAVVETDKVDMEINSQDSGVILELYAKEGDTIQTGTKLYKIKVGEVAKDAAAPKAEAPKAEAPKVEAPKAEAPKAAAPPAAAPKAEAPKVEKKAEAPAAPPAPKAEAPAAAGAAAGEGERRVKMTRLRLRIAERLKESQETAASLTTFNEIDMRPLSELREKYKDAFLKKHGVKLGFMSPFIKAASIALKDVPEVNASVDGTDIVYHDYCDISVAVATPKGLVTPVIRGTEKLTYVDIERELATLGNKARDNKITIEDLAGGTFTISNGGVFGSLMGTPIINVPQSAILGMHAIKERPVAIGGQVVIRPMMYVALTYDHRIIDGREAVTFLVRLKELIEDPRRILLEL